MKKRIQISLAAIFLLTLATAIVVNRVRPYFLPPPKWHEFSQLELKHELNRGRAVVVYFRDDWWLGFEQLEAELLTGQLTEALNENNAVIMIANALTANAEAEKELRRISGTNQIPAVAIYSPDRPTELIDMPIELQSLIRCLAN